MKRLYQEARLMDMPDGPVSSSSEPMHESSRIGPGQHEVESGESLAEISERAGHYWRTIWDDPANAALKHERQDPNLLRPGDVLTIPPLHPKSIPCAAGRRHVFRRKGVPGYLRVRALFADDRPRAHQPYELTFEGGLKVEGTTNGDGRLEVPVPTGARAAVLVVGPDGFRCEVDLGRLAPLGITEGLQGRLNNLGFPCGSIDGVLGPRTTEALRRFQQAHGLEPTGSPDQATLHKLREIHES